NGTPYGLAATYWTSDPARLERFGAGLEAGIVWANCWMVRDLRTPFGGMKQSGLGREGGEEAIRFFTEPSNVCVRTWRTRSATMGIWYDLYNATKRERIPFARCGAATRREIAASPAAGAVLGWYLTANPGDRIFAAGDELPWPAPDVNREEARRWPDVEERV